MAVESGLFRPLTKRQRDVLLLVKEGLSYKRIALRLGISHHTAERHVDAVATQLPPSDAPRYRRVQAWALRHLREDT